MLERARRGPWVDVVVLIVLLLAQRSVLGLDDGTFTSDEGAYAAQAVALADGDGWAVDDPFLGAGPDGEQLTSYVNATVADGEVYPYAKHPLWPSMLAWAYGLGGEAGMYLVPLVAAALVPLVAWRLAAILLGPGARRVAFWAAAVSPAVVVNGHVLWAHSASALAAGLTVLGVVEARRSTGHGPRLAAAVGLAAAGALAGVLLRSEGLLVAGAIAAGLGAVAVARRRLLDGGLAAAVGGAGGVGFLLGSAWRDSIAGEADRLASRGGDGGSRLGDAVSGAFHDLVGDQARSGRTGVLLLAVAATCAVLAGLAARRRRPDAPVLAGAAVVALALAWVVAPDETVTGIGAAWPIGLAGLVALRLPDRDEQRLLLVVAGLFAAAVFATNYAEGGGLEWGGRFLSPLTVLGAVGAASLWSALTPPVPSPAPTPATPTRAGSRGVAVLGVAACVVVAGFATTAMRGTRAGGADAERRLAAIAAPAGLATNEFLPNIVWRTRAATDWIVVGDDAPGRAVGDAVAALEDAGVDRFVSVGVAPAELVASGADIEHQDGRLVVARLG